MTAPAGEPAPPGPRAGVTGRRGPLWHAAGGWRGVAFAALLTAGLRALQLLAVGWLAADADRLPPWSAGLPLWRRLLIWDGGWFINVATEGYPDGYSHLGGHITGNGLAFFPMFPALINLGTRLGLAPAASSLAVVTVAGLAAGVCVYLLGVSLWSRRAGYALLVLVCAQPMAVVLSMGYTEAVFLALVSATLLAAHRRAWWAAGLLGLGAALTRPTGAAVGAALAVAALALWVRVRQGRTVAGRGELVTAFGAAALALLGVPAFLAWVGWRVGQWHAWFTVQTVGWGSTFDLGRSVVGFGWRTVWGGGDVVAWTTVLLLAGSAGLAVLAFADRLWPPLLTFGFTALVLVLGQSGYWHSKPRLLIPVLLMCCAVPARRLARLPGRVTVVVLGCWAAFGAWFGGYMITVWPYAV